MTSAPAPRNIPEQTPSASRKRKWLWILSAVIALLALLAFLILGTPRNYRVSDMPEMTEFLTIQKIMQKLTASLLDKDGKFVECAMVSLSQDEVNVLLINGLRAAQPRKAQKGNPTFSGIWSNGELQFQLSQPLGPLAVNADTRIVPELRNGKLSVRVNSAWVGWFPLPSFLLQSIANRTIAELENKNEVRTVIALFQSIQVKGDQLEIRFYPKNLNSLFSLFLK